jgi:putative holliday junction resolvase
MRALGIDLGSKRIGIATSDRSETLASPLTVVMRSGSIKRDHQVIAALVAEEEADLIVVGLPLSMDGSIGKAAQAALDEAELIGRVAGVPVEMFDERLTTVSAHRSLIEQNMRREARRKVVDKVAAAVLLQAWLERRAEAR